MFLLNFIEVEPALLATSYLQYKMFLLNQVQQELHDLLDKFTIQNVPIKYKYCIKYYNISLLFTIQNVPIK